MIFSRFLFFSEFCKWLNGPVYWTCAKSPNGEIKVPPNHSYAVHYVYCKQTNHSNINIKIECNYGPPIENKFWQASGWMWNLSKPSWRQNEVLTGNKAMCANFGWNNFRYLDFTPIKSCFQTSKNSVILIYLFISFRVSLTKEFFKNQYKIQFPQYSIHLSRLLRHELICIFRNKIRIQSPCLISVTLKYAQMVTINNCQLYHLF